MTRLDIGAVIAGRYAVETLLGTGGTSAVYRARDLLGDARVAVKLLSSDVDRQEWTERFDREIRACRSVRHPNIVRVGAHGLHLERPFLVMELLEGGTLARFIEGGSPMAESMATALLRPISAGLQHIHERGLVHRDIKPENIMLDDHGSPRLVDFGLAINRSRPRGDARLTSVGAVVGTPEYLSPEQVFGRPLDGRSDVFSLGVTAYELLTGRLPFDGPAIEVARQNALEDPPPMRERNPAVRVAPPLERLVFDMLERCPQHRPDAAEVARTLDRIATAAPVEPERDRASWLTVGLAAALGTAAVVLALPL